MNQVFNLNRFLLLFKKHTADNYKTYLMSFFVLFGVMFLIMSYVAYMTGGKISDKVQIPIFIFLLLLSGTIFTSTVFADFGNKKKAISMLTLPASHFEKYFIGWVYTFVIFQVLFIVAFYLVAMLVNQASTLKPGQDINLVLDLFSRDEKVYIVFYIYTVLHAFTLWGSIFFKKYHFIKTAFTLFIGGFLLIFLNLQTLRSLISPEIKMAIPFTNVSVRTSSEYTNVSLSMTESVYTYLLIMLLTVVLILWASSFYRLKEKEV